MRRPAQVRLDSTGEGIVVRSVTRTGSRRSDFRRFLHYAGQQEVTVPQQRPRRIHAPAEAARRNGSPAPAEVGGIPRGDRVLGGSGENSADGDQTLADADQTLADADQIDADSDQTSAAIDQLASDRDQEASDRDLALGGDPREHKITHDIRERTTRQREETARARLDAASERDAIARHRDLVALARDQAADARDLAIAQRDAEDDTRSRADRVVQMMSRATEHRKSAAERRVLAAEYRAQAAEDRRAAALDRVQAAEERLRALADRETLAAELSIAETDPLTGARTRAAGLTDLDHEIDRCRRTDSSLVIAYVDVVGLKQLNDTVGHGAGDELLRQAAALFTAHLRSYDLIVRLGGDEFLCAISNMPEADVRRRFSAIAGELAATPDARGIRTGFATLGDDETATDFIGRADAELLRSTRQRRRSDSGAASFQESPRESPPC
jgi:diguanylate cyclase (GGDEF)-like protein